MKRNSKLNLNTCKEVINQNLSDLIVFILLIRILDPSFDMHEPQHPYSFKFLIISTCLLTLITQDQESFLMNLILLNRTMIVEWTYPWMTDQESLEFLLFLGHINLHYQQRFSMRRYQMILRKTTTSVRMNI